MPNNHNCNTHFVFVTTFMWNTHKWFIQHCKSVTIQCRMIAYTLWINQTKVFKPIVEFAKMIIINLITSIQHHNLKSVGTLVSTQFRDFVEKNGVQCQNIKIVLGLVYVYFSPSITGISTSPSYQFLFYKKNLPLTHVAICNTNTKQLQHIANLFLP